MFAEFFRIFASFHTISIFEMSHSTYIQQAFSHSTHTLISILLIMPMTRQEMTMQIAQAQQQGMQQ